MQWTINEQSFHVPPVAQFITASSGKTDIVNAYSHDPINGNRRQRIEWPDVSWPALELIFDIATGDIVEIHWQPRNLEPFNRAPAPPPTKG